MSDPNLPSRPSLQSLSGSMHSNSYSRSYPSTRSAGSSPSSESSHSSYQNQEVQRRWHNLAMTSTSEGQHQELMSASASSAGLLGFEGINLGQSLSSPYLITPSTSSSDLPTTPFDMPNVGPSNPYGHHVHRPQSAMGTLNPGASQVMLPLSAPPERDLGFSAYQLTGMQVHHHQHTPSPPGIFSPTDDSEEAAHIMNQLQMENEQLRNQVLQMQAQLHDQRRMAGTSQFDLPSMGGMSPRPASTPEMEESWRRRTEARIRKFCSPNRAGNALCGWHDPRRERRMYPPRMAPEGVLNCGCTYEQALFEESLARHGVGSYLPGENVRMDPNLRNPLLKLLQERYGYRDGDFERNPFTGKWRDGEGPEKWEQEAHNHGSRHGSRR